MAMTWSEKFARSDARRYGRKVRLDKFAFDHAVKALTYDDDDVVHSYTIGGRDYTGWDFKHDALIRLTTRLFGKESYDHSPRDLDGYLLDMLVENFIDHARTAARHAIASLIHRAVAHSDTRP